MKYTACLAILAALLSACGTDPGERTLSGAGIGAGTGAVAGAVLGGPVLGAAALGAVAGGATGALTSPNQINLDR